MSERIGVYLCHCGTNIAEGIDIKALASFASTLGNVVVVRDDRFMCSGDGQGLIERDIKENSLSRIVIVACSPHLHEPTFRKACARAGLNPYFCEIVNVREHDAWTAGDTAAATEKAKALVSAAVHRVLHHKPLSKISVPVNPDTLVIGGGIAGITAALEIADAGRQVYLVERAPSIGGRMAQLDKTFPTLDCADCMLDPRMAAVRRHPHITLLTYSEVEEAKGRAGSFTIKVRKKARFIDEDRCIGCGICQQKCPQEVHDNDFEAGLGLRKACAIPFAGAVPRYPVIDRNICSFFELGQCRICEKECPAQAVRFDQSDTTLTLTVGNIVIATGFDLFDPLRIPQYGYGRYPNVFTGIELERMLSAAGPTGGKVMLRDRVAEPESVAIIHCVGSRDKNYHDYCSKVCCMYSLKFAHLIKEKTGASVYNFYIDMRAGGKTYEEFYQKLLGEKIHFVRGRVATVMDSAYYPEEEGKLVIQAEDTLLGIQRRIPVDMVVLSTAMEARADARSVARLLGVECDSEGFFAEKHPKLDPVVTLREGIFVAGACQGPKDITETIAQAGAAAAKILSLINKGTIELEPIRASIDKERCSGCRMCLDLCPYSALSMNEKSNQADIDAALCQGCGACVAACPARAITSDHFTDEQMMAEIEGILYDRDRKI